MPSRRRYPISITARRENTGTSSTRPSTPRSWAYPISPHGEDRRGSSLRKDGRSAADGRRFSLRGQRCFDSAGSHALRGENQSRCPYGRNFAEPPPRSRTPGHRQGSPKPGSHDPSFFSLGAFHVQFNTVSTEELRKAQAHPEEYRDLLVRVAGYSTQFVNLSREMQEAIIARTEHGSF